MQAAFYDEGDREKRAREGRKTGRDGIDELNENGRLDAERAPTRLPAYRTMGWTVRRRCSVLADARTISRS